MSGLHRISYRTIDDELSFDHDDLAQREDETFERWLASIPPSVFDRILASFLTEQTGPPNGMSVPD